MLFPALPSHLRNHDARRCFGREREKHPRPGRIHPRQLCMGYANLHNKPGIGALELFLRGAGSDNDGDGDGGIAGSVGGEENGGAGRGMDRLARWTFRSFSHGCVEFRSYSCWQDRRGPRWGGGKGSSTWLVVASTLDLRAQLVRQGVWSADFLQDEPSAPDRSTESVDAACMTFSKWNASFHLPTAVWDTVNDQVPPPEDESEEEQNNQQAEEDKRGAAALEPGITVPASGVRVGEQSADRWRCRPHRPWNRPGACGLRPRFTSPVETRADVDMGCFPQVYVR